MFEIYTILPPATQLELLQETREILKQAPLIGPTMPRTGVAFRLLCSSAGACGWHSDKQGYGYLDTHPRTGKPFPPMPTTFRQIAIDTASAYGLKIDPQTALINWYGDKRACLGLHQDKDEQALEAPVISISLGAECDFLAGGLTRNSEKRTLRLTTGMIMIMGAEDRLAFHQVKAIYPETTPAWLGMTSQGRINITIRQVLP